MTRRLWLATSLWCALGTGCAEEGPATEVDAGAPTEDGGAAPDGGAEDGGLEDMGVRVDAGACEEMQVGLRQAGPRVMILLDQSSSMRSTIDWLPELDRWGEVRDSLTRLIRDPRTAPWSFGLDAFPDGDLAYLEHCRDACCEDPACQAQQVVRCAQLSVECNRGCAVDLPPVVPVASATVSGPAIIDYLGLDFVPPTFGSTPLVAQLEAYSELGEALEPALFGGEGLSFLLLISDGEDTCFDPNEVPDQAAIVSALGAATARLADAHGVRTFVVGFDDTSGRLAAQLDAVAAHGGTGLEHFIPIDGVGALDAAFDLVTEALPKCVYAVDGDVEGLDRLEVRVGGEVVPQQTTCVDGWRWASAPPAEPPLLELCGAACAEGLDVEAVVPCP